jgi:Holliday junction resolvase
VSRATEAEAVRRAARTDANQDGIVAALRGAGASVQSLAATGKGCPDLLVGWRGANLLMECKQQRDDRKKLPT